MNREYNTLILAALLHDIGKFYQKGDSSYLNSTGTKHPDLSVAFVKKFKSLFEKYVDFPLLVELVQRHHENGQAFPKELLAQEAPEEIRHLCILLSCADNLSSSERDEEAEKNQNFRTRPMASIFTSVSVDDSLEKDVAYYKPAVFAPENCFPDPNLVQNIVSKNAIFTDAFTAEIEILSKQNIKDFNTLYTLLNTLLLKYLWCIPSSSLDRVPDVSLYDHLKTTSAIAACLYQYHEGINDWNISSIRDKSTAKFKMVLGDFSGIQKFIFEVSNTGVGGIAKRLRARSFYVNTLLEVISHYICHAFSIPLNNILISSGGKFYILIPNIPDAGEKLEAIVREVEQFLFKESAASISINLAVSDINGESFEQFDDVIGVLNTQLHDIKKRQFSRVIQKDGQWAEDKFIIFDDLDNKVLCSCCHKNMVEADSSRICRRCLTDAELGQHLANARYIYYSCTDENSDKGFSIFKSYTIYVEKELKDISCYLLSSLNNPLLPCHDKPIGIKYMANYIPTYDDKLCSNCDDCDYVEGQPLTFECIAKNATGKKLIGVYKADVDNLGFLFMEGLKREQSKSRNTVSRITTFSRMLEMFFTGYLNKLIAEKYPFTYCVFSGGDDLFLIGPWDMMVDMSMEINKVFHEYTGNNSSFSISAAILPVKPKYPISKAAEDVEECLEEAKDKVIKHLAQKSKDQISFNYDLVKWDVFAELIEQGKWMEELLKNGIISTDQIRRLIGYSGMYRDFLENTTVSGLRFLPMLTYDISRNYSDRGAEERRFREWVLKLRKEIRCNKNLYYLNISAGYAWMKTRKEDFR